MSLNDDPLYWTAHYNLLQNYDVMGDYLVFIMTVTDPNGGNTHFEDFLYHATKTDNPTPPRRPDDPPGNGDVPEPATVLLWTLGSLGFRLLFVGGFLLADTEPAEDAVENFVVMNRAGHLADVFESDAHFRRGEKVVVRRFSQM